MPRIRGSTISSTSSGGRSDAHAVRAARPPRDAVQDARIHVNPGYTSTEGERKSGKKNKHTRSAAQRAATKRKLAAATAKHGGKRKGKGKSGQKAAKRKG